jgi:predicted AAA+ superfamily ATPase
MNERSLAPQIRADLKSKMVFLGGPRQVGKTTLCKALLKDPRGYLNWDIAEDREKILKREFSPGPLWVFDELHKYKTWRNYLKGLYDQQAKVRQILVTGSARLDLYRRGGESLQGRYHYLRLHPLTISELRIKSEKDFRDLLKFGGFPEPFFKGSEAFSKRWSREYRARLIQEDVVTLERVQDLGNLELMMTRLPDLVGSPLSINNLREDLQVSHKAVSNWLSILERLYGLFRLSPFGAPKIRAVKKEQKHYHFDWTLVKEEGLRFENFCAAHLLKWVHLMEDAEGRAVELRYFRDIDRREVDFVIVEDQKPTHFIECKWSDSEISPHLKYLCARFKGAQGYQITASGARDYVSAEGIRVMPALEFFKDKA